MDTANITAQHKADKKNMGTKPPIIQQSKKNDKLMHRKLILRESAEDQIDSILDFACTATASLAFQEIGQSAWPFDTNCNQMVYFVKEVPVNLEFKMGEIVENKNASRFRATHGFDAGVKKQPDALACAWIDFQAWIQHFQFLLSDATMSLKHNLDIKIEYIRSWIQIWQEMKHKISTVDVINNDRHAFLADWNHADNMSDPELYAPIKK